MIIDGAVGNIFSNSVAREKCPLGDNVRQIINRQALLSSNGAERENPATDSAPAIISAQNAPPGCHWWIKAKWKNIDKSCNAEQYNREVVSLALDPTYPLTLSCVTLCQTYEMNSDLFKDIYLDLLKEKLSQKNQIKFQMLFGSACSLKKAAEVFINHPEEMVEMQISPQRLVFLANLNEALLVSEIKKMRGEVILTDLQKGIINCLFPAAECRFNDQICGIRIALNCIVHEKELARFNIAIESVARHHNLEIEDLDATTSQLLFQFTPVQIAMLAEFPGKLTEPDVMDLAQRFIASKKVFEAHKVSPTKLATLCGITPSTLTRFVRLLETLKQKGSKHPEAKVVKAWRYMKLYRNRHDFLHFLNISEAKLERLLA